MKGERVAKRSSFGSIVRKRLSDITNSQSQTKLVNIEEKQPPISDPTEGLINQLLKEKATLMKLVEEKDKIIALSNNQMRSLRLHYQKLQMQNWNLAQSNSQMLAEINLGREKLKSLQHELICKDALLKAKNLELEGKTDITSQNNGSQEAEKNAVGECLYKASNGSKPGNHRIRRRVARSQSMGPSTTSSRQDAEKEKLENKRRCLRRQSARFKSQEREPSENLFEIEDVTLSITQQLDNPVEEDAQTLPESSVIKEEETCDSRTEAQVPQRSSLGRPVRRAAGKVQSYKEAPINVKLRRKD
ncbi:SHUGOSHIN 1 [Ricinus communis]|uniref:SHUGOSHIN 1 n=1 Tax=Ricinus communis TaxID=3988 RepID=UPI00201B19B6|nr:SHUGOSHIN 1 [Ricinus communis]